MIFRNSLLPAAPCAGNSGRNRDITLHLIQHFSPTMQCQCSCTLGSVRNPNPWMAVLSLDPAVRIPSSPVGDHRNPCEGDPISSVILRDGPAGSAKEQQQQMTQFSLTSCSQGRTSCLSLSSIHSWETQTPCTCSRSPFSWNFSTHAFSTEGTADFGMHGIELVVT